MLIYILKIKQHYFINTPSLWCGILRLHAYHAENSTFLSVELLDFLFCFLSSSHWNSENHSWNCLKFHESMTNMMRICLLWASPLRILPWKLYIMNVKFWVFRFVLAYWQTEINSCNLTKQFRFKMVLLRSNGSSNLCQPLYLSLQNFCKVQYIWYLS